MRFGFFSVLRANTYGGWFDSTRWWTSCPWVYRPIGNAEINHPRNFYNPSDPDILYPEPKKK